MTLHALAEALRGSRGFLHKGDIAATVQALAAASGAVRNGDDCAAIADGDGHLLLAIEGFVEDFVRDMPWFAGWCGVMVNLSDIAAMGGRPVAVVDALWSAGAEAARPLLEGLAAASERYGVPLVGGHTNQRAPAGQLAVAVLGRAGRTLLTSFDARPGDRLLMAVDLRGSFMEPNPFWNAATEAPAARLRGDLEILPGLAEDGLCRAGKDISMAGAVGTALMLAEGSKVGLRLDVDRIPRPDGVAPARWLQAFPSFGFVLSVAPGNVDAVLARFRARGIAAAAVGEVEAGSQLRLRQGAAELVFWDHAERAFVGA